MADGRGIHVMVAVKSNQCVSNDRRVVNSFLNRPTHCGHVLEPAGDNLNFFIDWTSASAIPGIWTGT
jgi:hypothetical protein